ncbi:MAG: hypothetical protein MJA27_03710 [Pseudanabaenales cyanobacterium]|nr:hypothetical protein [Pseudanabaenales cyanobacterium]
MPIEPAAFWGEAAEARVKLISDAKFLFMKLFPLTVLQGDPRSTILAYPHGDSQEVNSRIQELAQLAVHSIYDFGCKPLKVFHVLGVGYCGVVALARLGSQDVALKIRRTNAPKADFQQEAAFLAIANQVGVGPRLLSASRNFLVMDYIAGDRFLDWVKKGVTSCSLTTIQSILRRILQDSYRLDDVGLDHGNLQCISDHIIVSGEQAVLIDFSSASRLRRAANVTSVTQGLFLRTQIATPLAEVFPLPPKRELIEVLRHYKRQQTGKNFDGLLKLLGLN